MSALSSTTRTRAGRSAPSISSGARRRRSGRRRRWRPRSAASGAPPRRTGCPPRARRREPSPEQRRPARAGIDDGHRRAPVHGALHRDVAAQQARELVHQREPDAGPFLRARPRAGDAVESVEDVRQLVRGDPDARVGDLELDLVRRDAASDTRTFPSKVNFRAFEIRFSRIFSHMSGSIRTGLRQRLAADLVREAGLAHRRVECVGQIPGEGVEADGLERHAGASCLDAREVEQAARRAFAAGARCGGRSRGRGPRGVRAGERSASVVGPSISVSGVRSSWLMLLKNSVLARSSSAMASARRRSSSEARARAIAEVSCEATSARKRRYPSEGARHAARPKTTKPYRSLLVAEQRDDDGPLGRDAVATARQRTEAAREVVDGDGLTGAQRLAEWPPARRAARRSTRPARDAGLEAASVGVPSSPRRYTREKGTSASAPSRTEAPRTQASVAVLATPVRSASARSVSQLSLALNLFGRLLDREQDAADLAVVAGHGALRERVEGLLREAAAVDEEQLVLAP